MTRPHLAALGLVTVAAASMLTACAPAVTEEQTRAADRTCSEALEAVPGLVEQAWINDYQAMWEREGFYWEFGAGDICFTLNDEATPEEWAAHAGEPSWFVDLYNVSISR
jgi:hypothetical protein